MTDTQSKISRETSAGGTIVTSHPPETKQHLPPTFQNPCPTSGLHWVFAYGSLIWKPDFPFATSSRAQMPGYHRHLCIKSYDHRGTPSRPGLVFGLIPGGSCGGMIFGVKPKDWDGVYRKLHQREMSRKVYTEKLVSVRALNGKAYPSLAYLVREDHDQYVLPDDEETIAMILQGAGKSGSCYDYVLNTHACLKGLKIADPYLDRLVLRLKSLHDTPS